MEVLDLLAQRRPHRADARRNFDSLLQAAQEAFTELGVDVPLEEVARRAGVGIATLYRNFPTRDDLIECAYMSSVDALCRYSAELEGLEPWEALVSWLRRFVVHLSTKHALIAGLNRASVTGLTRESKAYQSCRTALYGVAGPLFERAQQAHAARPTLEVDDVLRLIFAVTAGVYRDDDQRERVFGMVVEGMREPSAGMRGKFAAEPARL